MDKLIDRQYFFSHVQAARPLHQSQVDNLNAILDHYDQNNYDLSLAGLGSYLGQSETESAKTWAPIREMGPRSYFRYLIGKLGITNMDEAWMFRGWGRIQTTGKTGFAVAVQIINEHLGKTVFEDEYDLGNWLLNEHSSEDESLYDLIVGFTCVSKGMYTGHKMNDYMNPDGTFDFYNARKVINPGELKSKPATVRAIAADSEMFFDALQFTE